MHDIDRTQIGFGSEPNPFQYGGRVGRGRILSEEREADLAMELLSASNEQELENFLGDLIKQAGSAVGSFIKSPTGQALAGTLKDVAKQYLPVAGKALGGMIGGQTGANIGGQLGSAVSGAFEMEASEQEMEDAKTFVRLAVDAAKNAAAAPPNANPRAVAQQAVAQAAQMHAPGLLQSASASAASVGGGGTLSSHSGRWMRRGNKIVLYGV
jgi:uncharacterized protein (DUF697 family)